jgi:hypothetical protein
VIIGRGPSFSASVGAAIGLREKKRRSKNALRRDAVGELDQDLINQNFTCKPR